MFGNGQLPAKPSRGKLQKGGRIGLNHIGWRPSGVPAAIAQSELYRSKGRNSQFDGATGMPLGQQGADRPGRRRQLGTGQRTRISAETEPDAAQFGYLLWSDQLCHRQRLASLE